MCRTAPWAAVHSLRGTPQGLGGGLKQHLPRSGPGLAQQNVEMADAGAAAGGLHAPDRVFVLIRCRGCPEPDRLPVGLQFVGHNHWDGGVNALAHLRLRDGDGDDVIRRNTYPGTEGKIFRISLS